MTRTRSKTVFLWSGGKDSALALYRLLQDDRYEVVSLLTTVDPDSERSSMHDIPLRLLQRQADRIGLPLQLFDMPTRNGMADYDAVMQRAIQHFQTQEVTHFAFGDLCLYDVKSYRQQKLAPYGIEVVEPLWELSSAQVMGAFLASGLQTVIVTTKADLLDASYIGRTIDASLIASLPAGCDPCGEQGEYHTFCYAGDLFREPIPFTLEGPQLITKPFKMSDGQLHEFTYWSARLKP